MGMDELPLWELVSWDTAEFRRVSVAEMSEHSIVFVQQGDDAGQIGDEEDLVANLEVARLTDSCRDKADVFSFKGELLDSSVRSICHE